MAKDERPRSVTRDLNSDKGEVGVQVHPGRSLPMALRRYSSLPPYHHLRYSCLSIRRLEDILAGFIFTLTILNDNVQYRMRNYSITEAAEELGIQRATLYEWIRLKKIPAPTAKVISRVRFRFWTEEELKTLKRYKAEYYQKKPSRKRKLPPDITK